MNQRDVIPEVLVGDCILVVQENLRTMMSVDEMMMLLALVQGQALVLKRLERDQVPIQVPLVIRAQSCRSALSQYLERFPCWKVALCVPMCWYLDHLGLVHVYICQESWNVKADHSSLHSPRLVSCIPRMEDVK